jgi:UDP-N-acetylglucosamine--N-acetylmuramyl-(pentapeptide) pyrophosphoryl-undecaprenol N-acetylglucosamine transferase
MAEIGALGTASVLIPSPNVANNHQVFNARELADHGGAVMIEEKDLTPRVLADTVNRLMKDPEERRKLSENAEKAGKSDAAYRMIEVMEELCHG